MAVAVSAVSISKNSVTKNTRQGMSAGDAFEAHGCAGVCQANTKPCNGHYVSGQCPGASNVQCCTAGAAPAALAKGFDASQPISLATANCLKSAGFSFGVVRAWLSYGAADTHASASVANLNAAGFTPDVYLFPCGSGKYSGATQATGLLNNLGSSHYGRVWLDIETNPSSGCAWTTNHVSNCNMVKSMISTLQAKGRSIGIYSSSYMWSTIMGTSCNIATDAIPTWFATYDGSNTCSGWRPYGGWSKALWKQWNGSGSACGLGIDQNVAC